MLPEFAPLADPAAVVTAPYARFTVLTPRLLRLEFSPTHQFEDRASQAFWHRTQPVPPFETRSSAAAWEIHTEFLQLRYIPDPGGFTRQTLSIVGPQLRRPWRFGDQDRDNLRGTARTLDGARGRIRLEPGLVSRSGWAAVNDSVAPVFDATGWLTPRAHPENQDWYFFGYGDDYGAALRDFIALSGRPALLPRWALGNWWSRYWAYSDAELRRLMQDFQARAIPLAVCIVDMDWHITQTGNDSSGWTGYTWNRALFPDPEGFLAWLHAQGLKTALNLHPAEGVHPHEAAYAACAQRLGRDPTTGEPIPFDCADPDFMRAYFEVLLHPLEAQGVDFWWMDWQQGERSRLPGLDPLWQLNHLHFYDLAREGRKRPFVFSRWGGLGNHRYPIGFSGDTVVSWESLAFQPEFTATAANVGYGWWSHDIGGHMGGLEDGELYTRWAQCGVFSPILRLHSTNNPFQDRRPWAFNADVFHAARAALQLRHALIPYLYTMAWRNHETGLPLCLPLYYTDKNDDAYHCPQAYHFGTELIAAPFTAPRDPDTQLAGQTLYLPPGQWFDYWNGRAYAGGQWHALYGGLDDIPVVARAGAIVPLAHADGLTIRLFPGADNVFELREDDGETLDYLQGRVARTRLETRATADALTFTLHPTVGDTELLPASRLIALRWVGVAAPAGAELDRNGVRAPLAVTYDPLTRTAAAAPFSIAPTDKISARLEATPAPAELEPLATWQRLLNAFRLEAHTKRKMAAALPELVRQPQRLARYAPQLKDAHIAALLKTA